MYIQGISGTSIALLTPVSRLTGANRPESLIGRALESATSGTPVIRKDDVSIRHLNLGAAHTSLMRSHADLRIAQGRQTIDQGVLKSLNTVEHELAEIQRLTDAVADGEYSPSQLADIQLMIESRTQRIQNVIDGTTHSGTELLTGEAVRVTTDAVTGEGFDVWFDDLGMDVLGLGSLDVETLDFSTNAGIVSDAQALVSAAVTNVETDLSQIETVLEGKVISLVSGFDELRSSELLNTSRESPWLSSEAAGSISSIFSSGNLRNLLSTSDLRDALSITNLDAGVVASLLS